MFYVQLLSPPLHNTISLVDPSFIRYPLVAANGNNISRIEMFQRGLAIRKIDSPGADLVAALMDDISTGISEVIR